MHSIPLVYKAPFSCLMYSYKELKEGICMESQLHFIATTNCPLIFLVLSHTQLCLKNFTPASASRITDFGLWGLYRMPKNEPELIVWKVKALCAVLSFLLYNYLKLSKTRKPLLKIYSLLPNHEFEN